MLKRLLRQAPAQLEGEIESLKAQLAWWRWYCSEYAAALRLSQYDRPTLDLNSLIAERGREFSPIEELATGLVVPAPSNAAFTNEYIYFGARFMPLPHPEGTAFYAVSYLGSGTFAHSGRAFDALILPGEYGRGEIELGRSHGLADAWLAERGYEDLCFTPRGTNKYYRPLGYNSGDVDGDGCHDFIFGTWLILSSRGYERAADVPQESIFSGDRLISLDDDRLKIRRWSGTELLEVGACALACPPLLNVPFALLPLPESMIALQSERGLDVYRLVGDDIAFHGWIDGFIPGEIQAGAFGDFDGDGYTECWLSQVATPTRPNLQDQVTMIRPRDIERGQNALSDLSLFRLRGSTAYTDYDGISSTLSPIAGDVDGCGHPDLTVTGHRHMNESGALYVLRNRDIARGGDIDITDPRIVKIIGRPMSQLAPPYLHWDASDVDGDGYHDIVVPADNDLRAGLNAGAIYIVSGSRLVKLDAK